MAISFGDRKYPPADQSLSSNLGGWWEPDRGITLDTTAGTTTISSWRDRAAGLLLSQATKANQLLYTASSARGNGVSANVKSTSPVITTSNFMIVGCFDILAASTRGCFVKVGHSFSGYGLGIGSTTFEDFGNKIIGLIELKTWINSGISYGTGRVVVSLTLEGRSAKFYKNGTLVASVTIASNTLPIAPIAETTIGGYSPNRSCSDGILGVFVYSLVDVSTRENAENYLMKKYGVT